MILERVLIAVLLISVLSLVIVLIDMRDRLKHFEAAVRELKAAAVRPDDMNRVTVLLNTLVHQLGYTIKYVPSRESRWTLEKDTNRSSSKCGGTHE